MGTILFLIILVLLWQGGFWLTVDVLEVFKSYSVPSPAGVAERFVELCSDGTLLKATGNSLLRGMIGFAVAVVIGVILGLLIHQFSYLQKHMKPLVLG